MTPTIVFAHGAGAGATHPWMRAWAARLSEIGHVQTFDYDYMKGGRKRPDRTPVLLATHALAVHEACAQRPDAPLVLVGKSMGSRMGCHLAVQRAERGEHPPVAALVCFGYPLRSAASGASRADVLRQLRVPVLFIQGTRDALCPLDELRALLPELSARTTLHVVEGGDHSLIVAKKTLAAAGTTQAQVDANIAKVVAHFIATSASQVQAP